VGTPKRVACADLRLEAGSGWSGSGRIWLGHTTQACPGLAARLRVAAIPASQLPVVAARARAGLLDSQPTGTLLGAEHVAMLSGSSPLIG
jgi:hypothetical protein